MSTNAKNFKELNQNEAENISGGYEVIKHEDPDQTIYWIIDISSNKVIKGFEDSADAANYVYSHSGCYMYATSRRWINILYPK